MARIQGKFNLLSIKRRLFWHFQQVTYARNYDEEEDQWRFAIFKANVDKVAEHNELYDKGELSYSIGINLFSDRTPDELKRLHNNLPPPTPA